MARISTFISVLFHPMIMPLLCVFVATQFDWYLVGVMSPLQLRIIYLVVALSTIVFPALNVLLLRWYGAVSSLSMPLRKERMVPFVSTLFFFMLGYYLLRRLQVPSTIYSILFGSIIALAAIVVVNFKWKVSAHVVGISGLAGMLMALFNLHDFGNVILFSIVILMAGIVMTGRLLLNVHTPREVYLGALVGFCSLYIVVVTETFI